MGHFASQYGLFNSGGTRPMNLQLEYVNKPYDEEGDPRRMGLFLINRDCERILLFDTLEEIPVFLQTFLEQVLSIVEKEIAKNDL